MKWHFLLVVVIYIHEIASDWSYEEEREASDDYVDFHPHIDLNMAERYVVGRTTIGRSIEAFRLGLNRDDAPRIPNVKLIGGLHGNEPVATNILERLIQHLQKGIRENDEEVIGLLNSTTLHILPLLNSDGLAQAQEGLCKMGPGRANANGVDLNRNFPSAHYASDVGSPEPETVAVMKWMLDKHFMLSLSLTSGSLVASYPYDISPEHKLTTKETPTDDDQEFKYLAKTYVTNHHYMKDHRECNREIEDGIVNGAAWFPALGTMNDYSYDFHGCLELSVGISCCKYPGRSKWDGIWNENKEAILEFLKQANKGVRGVVMHGEEPVEGATVTIMPRTMEHKTTRNGDFWRFLLPGKYYLQVEKDGFKTVVSSFVLTQTQFDQGPLVIDINLELDTKNETKETDDSGQILTELKPNSFEEDIPTEEIRPEEIRPEEEQLVPESNFLDDLYDGETTGSGCDNHLESILFIVISLLLVTE